VSRSTISSALKELAYGIFSYIPIILLWRYVPADGSASNVEYVNAFRIFFFVAGVHLALAVHLLAPLDRIALATDFWLLLCGALAWAELWESLQWFAGHLRGTGVWLIAVPLCVFLALHSKYGVISAKEGDSSAIRRYSLITVIAMSGVLVASYFVRNSVAWSVIVPTVILSLWMGHTRKLVVNREITNHVRPN